MAQRRSDICPPRRARRPCRGRPLQPDPTLGAPGTLDLVAEIAATVTAPVLYAANARVLRADDRMRGSLVDVRA
jgi:hypothetical protein